MTEGIGKTEHPERGGGHRPEMKEKEKEKEEVMVVAGPSRETQISLAAASSFPGFRFSPTDEELISYYLKKKTEGCQKSAEVISEVEICLFEPWDLPAKSIIQSQNEWFFFSARGRKYPNGSQSRRATGLGYWKATRKERNVKSSNIVIGTKRSLVFHLGRAPKGERTEWIMHEYCMYGKSQDTPVVCRLRRNSEFRLNDSLNRASVSQRQPTDIGNSNHAASDGGTDHMGVSDGDKANVGALARRTSSSYDSHFVEQLDCTSESNQKPPGDAAQAESSNHPKDCDGEQPLLVDPDPNLSIAEKQYQISEHQEAVKEKIILSQEKNIQKLNELVKSLRRQLLQCRNDREMTNITVTPLTEQIIELERQQFLED